MNRKAFLQMTGSGIIGAVMGPQKSITTPGTQAKLCVQLYTIRDAIEKDLEGSLQKLAEIGFKYVETAFWPKGVTLSQAAKAIKASGLTVTSCHVELPKDGKLTPFEEMARTFDCNRMIWHGWPEDARYLSMEGTKELIRLYNQTANDASDLRMEFGLHNHWWEFRNVVGGKSVHEWLLEACDPRIFFELDIYWIKVAGFDPSEIIRKFGKRAKCLHIKDGPAIYHDSLAEDNPDPMVAVGKGAQNIPAILQAQQAEYLIVEMDKVTGDPFEALRDSFNYLQRYYSFS